MLAFVLVAAVLVLIASLLLAYTLLVTPRRFCQCLAAPWAFVRRYPGDEATGVLPEPVGGNRIDLLVNGNEILPAMLEAINGAERSIRWLVMLFQPDEAGLALVDALVQAADRGVQIQLAFDIRQTTYSLAVLPYPRQKRQRFARAMEAMLRDLRDANISVLDSPPGIDQPLDGLSAEARAAQTAVIKSACVSANHFDHRKVLIADDQVAIVGGMNVGNEYLYHVPPDTSQDMEAEASARRSQGLPEPWEKWQDTAVVVQGPIVASLVREFNMRWEVLGGHPLPGQETPPATGSVRIRALRQRPGLREISTAHLHLIGNAEKEIFVASPYVSHDSMLEALMAASKRGVRVVFVFPGKHNDVAISRKLFRIRTGRLLASRVNVYENNLRMTHAKLLVVDGKWVSTGSFNLNHRSVNHDFELNLLIESPTLAQRVVERVFEPYRQQAVRLAEPYRIRRNIVDWLLEPLT